MLHIILGRSLVTCDMILLRASADALHLRESRATDCRLPNPFESANIYVCYRTTGQHAALEPACLQAMRLTP